MAYNWQLPDWRNFSYSLEGLEDLLYEFIEKSGHLNGLLEGLSATKQEETLIEILVAEAVKTSEIESEYLSREDVVSSIRHNLGLSTSETKIRDLRARGIGQLMVEVRQTYNNPLSSQILKEWHKLLFYKTQHINVGQWRSQTAPIRVVSGRVDDPKIHFEAPPSSQVALEMKKFIEWFNVTSPQGKSPIKYAPIRSAIAHIYFESIHPFEDGNGRIGRAISDKALSQSLGYATLLSLSTSIEKHKKTYYSALEKGQKSNEITEWITYFIETIIKSQNHTEDLILFTFKKARFFDKYAGQLNKRQLKTLRKMFDKEPEGFKGGMTSRKHISINRISKATATRDLSHLEKIGALRIIGRGRNTAYLLNFE